MLFRSAFELETMGRSEKLDGAAEMLVTFERELGRLDRALPAPKDEVATA